MNTHIPFRPAAVLDVIGNTPLLPLRFDPEGVTIHVKAEFLNPSGSVKDRFARCVVLDAEQRGLLKPDSILLECSSGNTGIALAMVGAAKGYRVTILMSEGASVERRHLIRELGAELILFSSEGRYQTGIEKSRELAAQDPRYFLPGEIKVSSADALAMSQRLHREHGLLVGTSSGANVTAALRLALDHRPSGAVVTLLCDRAERYFSTRLFQEGGVQASQDS